MGPPHGTWAARDGRGGGSPRGTRRGHAAHSVPVGRLFGIPLEVHWTFVLLVALVLMATLPTGAAGVVGGLLWVLALFASVVVHELAHCLVARPRGGDVLGILLLPIGGVSRMARLPSAPADETAIALAGPVTSLGIGALLLVLGAVAAGASFWPPTLVDGSWLARLGWLNLLLGLFNLLPALPMDGGRVLRAGLSRRRSRVRATTIAARVAKVVAAGLVVAGVLSDIWLVLIGVFVYLGASGEEAQARREDPVARLRPDGRGRTWQAWRSPPGPTGWPCTGPPCGRDARPEWPEGPQGWGTQGWGRPPGQAAARDAPARGRRGAVGSAVDVAVEGGRPDAGGAEALGEGDREHH
jgi:Zn-dependent protease